MLILGLIGYPIGHSVSPAMHNAAMEHLGVEGIYLALEVRPQSLRDAVFGAKALGFKGLNVTIPFKEEVAKFFRLDGLASKIKAVNTLDLERMLGYNTDAIGFIKALEEKINPSDKVVLVVGAGGVGKAIAYALLEKGSEVIISNRTMTKGIQLAEKLSKYGDCHFHPYEKIGELEGELDIIVNATPLGMEGFERKIPVPEELLHDVLVFDTVYNPPETPLIRKAKEGGCKVVNGLDMLVYQGAESLRIWIGREPPIDVMREAARKALGL